MKRSGNLNSYTADQVTRLCDKPSLQPTDLPWIEDGLAKGQYHPDELVRVLFGTLLFPPYRVDSGEVDVALLRQRLNDTFDDVATMRSEYPFMAYLERKYSLRNCSKDALVTWNGHGSMPVTNRSCDYAFPFVAALRHRLRWSMAAYDLVKEWEAGALPDVPQVEHKHQNRQMNGGWCVSWTRVHAGSP